MGRSRAAWRHHVLPCTHTSPPRTPGVGMPSVRVSPRAGTPLVRGPGVEAVIRACTSLTHLDLTNCSHLSDSVFEVLAECCHDLRSLVRVACVCARAAWAGATVSPPPLFSERPLAFLAWC
jgi:hypothetical protein